MTNQKKDFQPSAKHRRSTPMLSRAAREQRRWIAKPSAILSLRIYFANVYTSIADVSPMCRPMCRRCVWDIFGLGVHCRTFADCSALFGDISAMVFGVETSGENFNACIEIFLDVPMSWRSMAITRLRRRSFTEPLVLVALPWRCPNVCIARASGCLKSLVGP